MPAYVDQLRTVKPSRAWPWVRACHLVADSLDELRQAGQAAGVHVRHLQLPPRASWPHFDLTANARARAVAAGALEVTGRQVLQVVKAWAAGLWVPMPVVRLLARIQATEDQELVYAKGGGWWVDADQVAGRWARLAVQLSLVSAPHGGPGDELERYVLSQDGHAVLENPEHVPAIVPHLVQRERRRRTS